MLARQRTHLSLRIGDQLSGGSLQVRQSVAKHLRACDGSHSCGCCYCCLAGQRIQLQRQKKSLITTVTSVTSVYPIEANSWKSRLRRAWCAGAAVDFMLLLFVAKARIG